MERDAAGHVRDLEAKRLGRLLRRHPILLQGPGRESGDQMHPRCIECLYF